MKTHRPTFRSDKPFGASPGVAPQKPFKGSDPYRHVAVAYSTSEVHQRGGDTHRSESRKEPTGKV